MLEMNLENKYSYVLWGVGSEQFSIHATDANTFKHAKHCISLLLLYYMIKNFLILK